MSGFGPSPVYPGAMALDPTKHVHYVEGMVLGAADLRQEFAYQSHRDQWIVRDLLGYGTVWGLGVSDRIAARGPEIVVASGVAVSPRGQLIRVAPAQCAPLNDWLAGRTTEVEQRLIGTIQDLGEGESGQGRPRRGLEHDRVARRRRAVPDRAGLAGAVAHGR